MWDKFLGFLKIKNERRAGPAGDKKSSKRTILVIDDNEIDRKIVAKLLDHGEYNLLFADNGEAGLKSARQQRPDLILLDCVMPGISGTEVCQTIKKDKDLKSIPVIFLTGMDSPTCVINCYDIGAEHYLNKPINAKELSAQIDLTFKELDRTLP